MSTRTAYPATESNGDTWTTTVIDKLPGGWIGDVSVTADQGSITSEVDATGLTLTVTANASRRLRIEGIANLRSTVANDRGIIRLYKDGTQIKTGTILLSVSNTTESVYCYVTDTPSTGSHTYKMTVERVTGSGTMTLKANSTDPSLLTVTDIGPA